MSSEDSDVGDAGSRPHCLCEPQGSLSVWQHRGSCEASCPSLHVPVLHRIDEVDLAPLLVLQEPALVQEISEVPGPFPLVRDLQALDVEQVLDVPVLHHYDDFFNIAQLEQELSEQVIEQETLEVHAGLPSQRQQLREVCWALLRLQQRRTSPSRQVQFLNLVAVVPVVQRHGFGPDSVKTVWRLRSCSSSICLLCPVSCGQSTGAVLGPVVYARETRGDSTGAVLGCVHAQLDADARGDSTGAVFGSVVHARCCVWCFWPDSAEKPVEIPQVQFLDKVHMPFCAENLWRFHRYSSWTRFTCPLCRKPVEIPQVQFLDKVHMPFCAENQWRFHRYSSWTRLTCPSSSTTVLWSRYAGNCGVPQLQFLTRLACLSLCNDRCPGLLGRVRGQGCCHVRCCARRGSRRAEYCASQLQFFNKVFMPVVVHAQGVVGSDSPENVWRCRRCSSACFSVGPPGSFFGAPVSDRGVALTPASFSQVSGLRWLHQLVASLAHAFWFLRVWTNTCVNASPKQQQQQQQQQQ